MAIILYSAAALLVSVLVALVLLGRSGGGITRGRLGRAARIGRLSARLSTSWLGATVRRMLSRGDRRQRYDAERRTRDAQAVTETMGQMKGAFMKLGQMMSFVSDSIPAEYRAALKSLQASAPPMDFALLRDVAERELKMPLERAFARFDEAPLASASIGQVHRAQLPSGEEVVVKIQYPGVAEAIRSDLQNASMMYRMIGLMYPSLDAKPVVDELRERTTEELDYRLEADNQRAFHELFAGHPFIRVPRVIDSYSTGLILTSEYVGGRRFDEIVGEDEATRNRVAEILYRFSFGSIIGFGVFNGDPHPGNYLFDDDGKVVFLDYGCVKYFPEGMMQRWLLLVRAHFARDKELFHKRAFDLGFFPTQGAIDAELLFDFFGYFYEPFDLDREFRFSSEYTARSMGMVFKPTGRFEGMERKTNMPPDFVFVNRIQWGVYSILGALEATNNWHRIHREYLFGDAPETALGRAERAYREKWLGERGLSGPLLLRREGIAPRGKAAA